MPDHPNRVLSIARTAALDISLSFRLLPFKRPAGRLPGHWGWLRYLHFGLSVSLVLLLVYGFGFRDGASGSIAVTWFVIGNLAYYVIGIGLAYALKDNRAFCKYLCPVSVPLKITSRFSLLKIGGRAEMCNDCGACVKMCPMDVRIPEYILKMKRFWLKVSSPLLSLLGNQEKGHPAEAIFHR